MGKFVGDFNMGNIICVNFTPSDMGNIICVHILPRAKARGKNCADNVTHIKISSKVTPSINYFYSNRTYTVNF